MFSRDSSETGFSTVMDFDAGHVDGDGYADVIIGAPNAAIDG